MVDLISETTSKPVSRRYNLRFRNQTRTWTQNSRLWWVGALSPLLIVGSCALRSPVPLFHGHAIIILVLSTTNLDLPITSLGRSNGASVRATVVVDGQPEVLDMGIRSGRQRQRQRQRIPRHRLMMCTRPIFSSNVVSYLGSQSGSRDREGTCNISQTSRDR